MVTATDRVRAELQAYASNDEAWGDHLNEGVFERFDEARGQFTTVALTGNYTLDVQNYIADEARAATLKFTGAGPWTVTAPAVSYWYIVWNACTADLTLKPSGGTGSVIRAGRKAIWFTGGTTGYTIDPTLNEIATPTGNVAMGGYKITGQLAGTAATDGATLSNKLHEFALATASVDLNSQKITNLAAPTLADDAVRKSYVDTFDADRSAGDFKLTDLGTPDDPTDAANMQYVLDEIAAAAGINLPSMTGNADKYLSNDGTTPSWGTPTASISARTIFVGGW